MSDRESLIEDAASTTNYPTPSPADLMLIGLLDRPTLLWRLGALMWVGGALLQLGMSDRNYGWTVEMQIKAAQQNVRYAKIPVPYRRRQGLSKVSGTVRGTIGASVKILGLLALHDLGRQLWRR